MTSPRREGDPITTYVACLHTEDYQYSLIPLFVGVYASLEEAKKRFRSAGEGRWIWVEENPRGENDYSDCSPFPRWQFYRQCEYPGREGEWDPTEYLIYEREIEVQE